MHGKVSYPGFFDFHRHSTNTMGVTAWVPGPGTYGIVSIYELKLKLPFQRVDLPLEYLEDK